MRPGRNIANSIINALAQLSILSVLALAVAAQTTPQAGTVVTDSMGMKFSYIPAGEFVMGADESNANERPAHRVTISRGFYIGVYEVTQEQWEKVMDSNPSKFTDCAQCPVERLSYKLVAEFVEKLNARVSDGTVYRLPTEAEWEYAARAGTTGDHPGDPDAMTWNLLNSDKRTHPVGQKKPNAWGLYDMHGNVSEQVGDIYGRYADGPVTDPTGAATGSNRVYRGGSYLTQVRNLKSSTRFINSPNNKHIDLGVRLVMIRKK